MEFETQDDKTSDFEDDETSDNDFLFENGNDDDEDDEDDDDDLRAFIDDATTTTIRPAATFFHDDDDNDNSLQEFCGSSNPSSSTSTTTQPPPQKICICASSWCIVAAPAASAPAPLCRRDVENALLLHKIPYKVHAEWLNASNRVVGMELTMYHRGHPLRGVVPITGPRDGATTTPAKWAAEAAATLSISKQVSFLRMLSTDACCAVAPEQEVFLFGKQTITSGANGVGIITKSGQFVYTGVSPHPWTSRLQKVYIDAAALQHVLSSCVSPPPSSPPTTMPTSFITECYYKLFESCMQMILFDHDVDSIFAPPLNDADDDDDIHTEIRRRLRRIIDHNAKMWFVDMRTDIAQEMVDSGRNCLWLSGGGGGDHKKIIVFPAIDENTGNSNEEEFFRRFVASFISEHKKCI